ncbi:hypothetical protein LTR62_006407 [Meristemomyces frigidus]|uniref:PCI domain-containing protein n=1 Tax=Meristemomyces frigidus TaxID=1508187 RepID=A0AAN7TDH1_9PEZI|nr:hypothetical protein LTR62_006407 [Meristemomyces frigidus]
MEALWSDFALAQRTSDGYLLGTTISPEPPKSDPARLYNFHRWTNPGSLQTDLRYKLQYNPNLKLDKKEANTWLDIFTAYYNFTTTLLAAEEAKNAQRPREADWSTVYESWKNVLNAVIRAYQNEMFEAWTIPCLYIVGKYLRIFAIKADDNAALAQRDTDVALGVHDEDMSNSSSSRNEKLEDAARQIGRIFALCLGDRSPLDDSRKWALYYIANLSFKTYFRLNSISLSKNILRSLQAQAPGELPELSAFPRAHQVTFKYYSGVIDFLSEDYKAAEEKLLAAYEMCLYSPTNTTTTTTSRNRDLILTYLIPTKLLTSGLLPTIALLSSSPNLTHLFQPIAHAIKTANLSAFHAALAANEETFIKRRIYLTLERGRDLLLRNLFRKVFVAGGYEPSAAGAAEGVVTEKVRRTRIPIREFAAALRMAGMAEEEIGDGEGGVDEEGVECLLANCVYKNYMKGYISRDHDLILISHLDDDDDDDDDVDDDKDDGKLEQQKRKMSKKW